MCIPGWLSCLQADEILVEEIVGKYWHGLITRAARKNYPEASVTLDEVKKGLGTWFRVLGGQRAVRLDAASPRQLGQERTLLQRIAGTNRAVALATVDANYLKLPASIAMFPDARLNKDLYYWLSALAANMRDPINNKNWFTQNINSVRHALTSYPGLVPRYYRLVDAFLREGASHHARDEQGRELAGQIRSALQQPFEKYTWPASNAVTQWVPLWLYPSIHLAENTMFSHEDDNDSGAPDGRDKKLEQKKGRQGEYRSMPKRDDGLLATRLESLFSWAEYVGVDRPVDEGDEDEAERVVDDLDVITLSRDNKTSASRLKFDLDLPPEGEDYVTLGDGVLQPEWDYHKQAMQENYCSVKPMISLAARPMQLPKHLFHKSRKLRAQFEKLLLGRVWENAQLEGDELDMDSFLQLTTDLASGHAHSTAALYRKKNRALRDLSCLLLADVSFSTDAYINDNTRIIDCIRDSLYLFSEALSLTGDRFAINGFSSRRRSHVRLTWVKHFDEPLSPIVRGRIADLRPGYYTRMGAAIRYATTQLSAQPQEHKLLLILTDGKPNDLDRYEGRYGIEDTRMAINEASRKGIHPFCVTIDDKANDYLPYIFGRSAYVFVRNANELPYKLPKLYLKLTS
ncbi:MAG: VWA domain-containing protein [Gammaproteobacteria bacterium]